MWSHTLVSPTVLFNCAYYHLIPQSMQSFTIIYDLWGFHDTLYPGTVLEYGVHRKVGALLSEHSSNTSALPLLYNTSRGGILQTRPTHRKLKNRLHCLHFLFLFFHLYRVQESLSIGRTSTPLPNIHIDSTHTSTHSQRTRTPSRIHSSSSSSLIHHSYQHSLTDSPSSRKRSRISTDLSDKSNFEPKNLLNLFDEATLESKLWVVNATLLYSIKHMYYSVML